MAFLTFDQRVGEVLDVPGGLPDFWVHDDARVQADDVVAKLDHRPPPRSLDVVAQDDAERAVVVDALDAAVDLARLEEEAAPLRQRHELFHQVPGRGARGAQWILRMKSRLLRRRSRWYSSWSSRACSTSVSRVVGSRSRS